MTGANDGDITGRIDAGDQEVPYRIEDTDITYARLSIEPDGTVLVRAPDDMADPERIVIDNRGWIERRLATRTAAARECGVEDLTATVPILFGQAYTFHRSDRGEISLGEATLTVPSGTDLSDPPLKSRLMDALRAELDTVVPRVADMLEVTTRATRLDGELDSWSDHSEAGTILIHPRAAILPADLLEHLAFRELVFYKEAINDRSYWGDMVEQYPEYTAVSDRLLGYWLLSHASEFWNAVCDTE